MDDSSYFKTQSLARQILEDGLFPIDEVRERNYLPAEIQEAGVTRLELGHRRQCAADRGSQPSRKQRKEQRKPLVQPVVADELWIRRQQAPMRVEAVRIRMESEALPERADADPLAARAALVETASRIGIPKGKYLRMIIQQQGEQRGTLE